MIALPFPSFHFPHLLFTKLYNGNCKISEYNPSSEKLSLLSRNMASPKMYFHDQLLLILLLFSPNEILTKILLTWGILVCFLSRMRKCGATWSACLCYSFMNSTRPTCFATELQTKCVECQNIIAASHVLF